MRAAKPSEKAYNLADRNSLILHVSCKGHKSFRYKHRFEGKKQLLVIGAFPDTGQSGARDPTADARELIELGGRAGRPSGDRQAS